MSDVRRELNDRLTPRARELLDSLLEDMRDEVLSSASRRGVAVEIGARDIIEAFEEHTGQSRALLYDSTRRRQRLQLLLSAYAVTAALLALVAIVLTVSDRFSPTLLAAIASTSVALVGASLALLVSARSRTAAASARAIAEFKRQNGFAVFLERWIRIESLLRLLVAREMGASSAELPLGALLDAASKSGRIASSDFEELRYLLSMRNNAVHEGALDRDALVNATKVADDLVLRFESELAQ
jgi:hypothetical protein